MRETAEDFSEDKDRLTSVTSSIPMIYSNKLSKAGPASPPTRPVASGSVTYLNQTSNSQMRSKFSRERSKGLSNARSELYSDKYSKMKEHAKKANVVEAYSTLKNPAVKDSKPKIDESNVEKNMEIVLFEQDKEAVEEALDKTQSRLNLRCNTNISSAVVHRRFAASSHIR